MSATNLCDCYKNLKYVGVPLYIKEENDDYGEHNKEIPYKEAYRLPGIINIDENVREFPIVEENELFLVFQQMANIISNLEDYETNVLSFWILDMFIEGLHTAQNAKMPHSHQRATLLWIAYFFNYLQLHNVKRNEMFNHLKELIFLYPRKQNDDKSDLDLSEETFSEKDLATSFEITEKVWKLPIPPIVTEDGEINFEEYFSKDPSPRFIADDDEYSEDDETVSEMNVKDMNVILEILYRIFARLWVFREIQAVFHSVPLAEVIDVPYSIQIPKPLLKPDSPYYQKLLKQSFDEIEGEYDFPKHGFILPLQASEEAKSYVDQLLLQTSQNDSITGGKNKLDKKK